MREHRDQYVHVLMPYGSAEWPLVRLLRARWPSSIFHFGGWSWKKKGYRNLADIITRNIRLVRFGISSALRALRSGKTVHAFLVFSDMELLGCAIACAIAHTRVPVILIGFIFTPRRSMFLSALRRRYFKALLSLASLVICHSRLEESTYAETFRLPGTRFRSIPYGTIVNFEEDLAIEERGYAFSAGRSGRDYALLAKVFEEIDMPLHLVCDTAFVLEDVQFPPNVTVLRNCHGSEYIQELAGADFVVIPIRHDGISAGQMVLMEAMALGKAIIITRTDTTIEYGHDLQTLLFVERGSVESMKQAVENLRRDRGLRARIGENARQQYVTRHSIGVFAEAVGDAVDELLGTYSDPARRGAERV